MIRAFWKDGSLLTRFTLRTHDDDRSVSGSSTWKKYFYITKFYEKYQISVNQHIVHKKIQAIFGWNLPRTEPQATPRDPAKRFLSCVSIDNALPTLFFYFFSTHIFTHLTTFLHIFAHIRPFFSSDNFWITHNILAKVLSEFDKGVKSNNSEDITNYWVRRNLVFVAEIFPSQFLQLSTN